MSNTLMFISHEKDCLQKLKKSIRKLNDDPHFVGKPIELFEILYLYKVYVMFIKTDGLKFNNIVDMLGYVESLQSLDWIYTMSYSEDGNRILLYRGSESEEAHVLCQVTKYTKPILEDSHGLDLPKLVKAFREWNTCKE